MVSHNEAVNNALDIAAGVTMLATLAKILPAVAAIFTIVWTALRIYDWIREERKPE